MAKMSIIFLTSTGLSDNKICREFVSRIGSDRSRRVAIVTTAASGKSENKYAQLARTQFESLGFHNIDFVDIEFGSAEKLTDYAVIYVCGGNTFYLLHQLKKSGADKILIQLLRNTNVIYMGVSAGSIVLAPTIRAAATIDPDTNDIRLTDFTGLGIINFEVHPHYEPAEETEIIAYEKTVPYKVVRLLNTQAMVLSGTNKKLIG
jgi:dipeptidase E